MSSNQNLVEMLSGEEFPGIGRRTAERLAGRFGQRLYDLLDNGSHSKLDEVVTQNKKAALVAGWPLVREKRKVVRWMDERGLEPKLADTVFEVWGVESIRKLAENPYRLLFALPWERVDGIAAQMGVSAHNDARLVGAAEAASYQLLDSGSTWVADATLHALTKQLIQKRGQDEIDAEGLAVRGVGKALETGALIRVGDGYQVPGAFHAEREIESWIANRLNGARCPKGDGSAVEDALSGLGRALTVEQRVAVRNSAEKRLSIFYGGAGVGKTTVVKSVCEVSEELGRRPVLLALAAKAVRKLAQSTGRNAMTLARALNVLDVRDFENTTVVIDEFSMVSLLEFRRLLLKLPENAHLILCGDAAQLPSIGPGRLLHSLIRSDVVPCQELTITHRQAEDTGIPEVLKEIRNGKMPELPRFDFGRPMAEGIYGVDCTGKSTAGLKGTVTRLLDLFGGHAQVLSPLARYSLGCHAINAHIHRGTKRTREIVPGTPVVFTANVTLADGEAVVNGLQGVVTAIIDDNPRGVLDRHLEVSTDVGALTTRLGETEAYMDFAYALTVHRAQGSDWDTVIAVLPSSRLLERSTIYTALSRCKARCLVLAPDWRALAEAVAAPPTYDVRADYLFVDRPGALCA